MKNTPLVVTQTSAVRLRQNSDCFRELAPEPPALKGVTVNVYAWNCV
jgi:hypothetical protein